MQTNTIQLSLATKPAGATSSNSPSSGLLGSAGRSGEFGSWMQSAARPAAATNRSDSNTLPQDGSDLPAAKPGTKVDANAAKEKSQNSDDSAVVSKAESVNKSDSAQSKSDAKQSLTAQDTSENGSRETETKDGTAQAGRTPPATAVQQTDDAGAAVSDNSAQEVASQGVVQVDQETLDLETGDLEVAEVDASEVSQPGQQPVIDPNAEEVAQLGGALAQESQDGDAEVQNAQAKSEQSQAGGRINSDTPPPGFANASHEGLEHGKPFQPHLTDSESGQTLAQSETTVVQGDTLIDNSAPQSQTASIETTIDDSKSVETVVAPTPPTPVEGEDVVVDGFVEQVVSNSDVDEGEPELAAAPRTPGQSNEDPQVDLSAESIEQVVASVSSGDDRARDAADAAGAVAVGPLASDARPQETRASQVNTPAQPTNASQSVAADAASTNSGQQAGADSQMGRQAAQEQLAQTGVKSGSEGSARAEAQASSSSSATATATAAPAAGSASEPLARPQASVATAVPPQALNRMQQEQWGQRLGERTLMMVQQGPRVAYLQLDPPELGALQVRVHLTQGDQVSLNFSAPNAAVRDVLEQHLPRLREMFAEQGLNLAQSDVRDQSAGGRDRGDSDSQRGEGRYVGGPDETELPFMEMQVPVGRVDYYA